jgi:hypothetical protein
MMGFTGDKNDPLPGTKMTPPRGLPGSNLTPFKIINKILSSGGLINKIMIKYFACARLLGCLWYSLEYLYNIIKSSITLRVISPGCLRQQNIIKA